MLSLLVIREQTEEIISRLERKNFKDARAIILQVLELDNSRKAFQKQNDDNLSQQNVLANKIGDLFKAGNKDEAAGAKAEVATLKAAAEEIKAKLTQTETDIYALMVTIPNAPSMAVPIGKTPEENEVISTNVKELPVMAEGSVPHWELTTKYDIIDFELGNKIAGAGFPVYKGKGARLQRALINFFLDKATDAGYTEIQPPILINSDSGFGTGNLPDKEGQMYHCQIDDLFLIPTAEVPVTNIYRDVILKESDLPQKLTAYTPCFRREAGSYGKDVRGLNRLHQFDKVEIVQIQHPNKSYETLETMRDYVIGLLTELELPYRVLKLCGGDMSFSSALTYDLEVYSAAQQRWLEVSSVSNFESFQANRMKCRFKDADGKTKLVHTLNGSALALPRIVAALLENNQTPTGINLPKVLHKYTGFETIE
ncbi:MAG TPA: serine--tRNA ligase [Bacteroidia bacterium]|nr:serine--tRNA ligase [Bacteroidia bacterium]